MTNTPICASQPEPSANDRVAERCGRPELASTTPARYAARNPLACADPAAANATMPSPNVARGYSPAAGNAMRRSVIAPRKPQPSPITAPTPNS